jgi:hypothetical protein
MSILDLDIPEHNEIARHLSFEDAREMCLRDESLFIRRTRNSSGFSVHRTETRSRQEHSARPSWGGGSREMRDIYDAVSGGGGGDSYLGDGMWVGPGGHLYDRGR